MKHLFTSYKISKRLKEKEFDEPCLAYYVSSNLYLLGDAGMRTNTELKTLIAAPLYQQVIDWVFLKHRYIITYNPANKNDVDNQILEFIESIQCN